MIVRTGQIGQIGHWPALFDHQFGCLFTARDSVQREIVFVTVITAASGGGQLANLRRLPQELSSSAGEPAPRRDSTCEAESEVGEVGEVGNEAKRVISSRSIAARS